MISDLMRYGAIVAKVRGMYGKMLTDSDWRKLAGLRDVSSIFYFLRAHPAYERVLRSVQRVEDADELIALLRRAGDSEFERIFSYAVGEDREYLLYTVRRFELFEILAALRRVLSGGTAQPSALLRFFREKSVVDLPRLREARDMAGIRSAAQGSIYEAALLGESSGPGSGGPSYARLSILLENTYYAALSNFLQTKYRGAGRECLIAGAGLEADIINITSIFRVKRSFPRSFPQMEGLLLPIGNRLTPHLRRALIEASGEEAMLAALRPTMWGRYLAGGGAGRPIEYAFEKSLEDFSLRILRRETAGICVPRAYLVLRDIEIKRLSRLIKAVAYGRDASRFV